MAVGSWGLGERMETGAISKDPGSRGDICTGLDLGVALRLMALSWGTAVEKLDTVSCPAPLAVHSAQPKGLTETWGLPQGLQQGVHSSGSLRSRRKRTDAPGEVAAGLASGTLQPEFAEHPLGLWSRRPALSCCGWEQLWV